MPHPTTPLSPPEWAARLDELAFACEEWSCGDPAVLLAEAETLIRGCPAGLAPWWAPMTSGEELAMLRAAGAEASAALGLCSRHAAYMVSRAPNGNAMATVSLPGQGREASCIARNVALAIAGALAQLLARSAADHAPAQMPAINRSRSEPRS